MIAQHHVRSLKSPFLAFSIHEQGHDPGLLGCPFSFFFVIFGSGLVLPVYAVLRKFTPTIHEILELRTTKLSTFNPEDEGDGIHQVGLSGAIGSNNRREVLEGADDLVPTAMTEYHLEITTLKHTDTT